MTSTTVDFAPIVSVLVQLAAALLLALGTVAIAYLTAWIRQKLAKAGLEVTDAQKALFDAAAQKALGYAIERTEAVTADMVAHGTLTADLKTPLLANAADYLIDHFPDLLSAMGLQSKNGQIDYMAIDRVIEARLGLAALSKATAPATAGAAMSTVATPAVAA